MPQPHPATIRSLVDLIGNTPVMRLRKIAPAGAGTVWMKCEHYNPGGSIKDRVALAMIENAEASGKIRPGYSTIVEPTSGNTGIGLAIVCAAKGYRLILTMPESMSLERRALLQSYGAEVILTPEADVMNGAVARAKEIVASNPSTHFMPDQFANPANPQTHRTSTAIEILAQIKGPIDGFVSAIGTGGTISGVGHVLRQSFPACRVVGVEPETSAVISGKPAGPHKIQGIGAGFVPDNLDRSVITNLVTISDRRAYATSKRLCREEGLLVGISAGANVAIACDLAKELGPKSQVVTVLCDTGERYFSMDEYF